MSAQGDSNFDDVGDSRILGAITLQLLQYDGTAEQNQEMSVGAF